MDNIVNFPGGSPSTPLATYFHQISNGISEKYQLVTSNLRVFEQPGTTIVEGNITQAITSLDTLGTCLTQAQGWFQSVLFIPVTDQNIVFSRNLAQSSLNGAEEKMKTVRLEILKLSWLQNPTNRELISQRSAIYNAVQAFHTYMGMLTTAFNNFKQPLAIWGI